MLALLAAVVVSLSIPQNKTLPALSVPLELRIRNGAAELELLPSVRVRATSPSGETFLAKWNERNEWGELEFGLTDEEREENTLIVKPRETVELSVPAATLMDESWAHDGRIFTTPGTWTIEVLLFDGAEQTIVSNAATIEIETPAPKDLWIWQALQRGEAFAIADRVLREQPDSPYFPYFATLIRRYATLDKVEIIQRAIELHPKSPVVPSLRYAMALYYGMEADRVFFADRDFDKAVELAEKGRAELVRLSRSKDAWSRLKGAQKLGEFPSREYFLTIQRLRREKGNRRR